MSDYLCIAVTFLDQRFHGRMDGGEPEWPPSPLRLMQAIVAANGERIAWDPELKAALEWLESQEPPVILAPQGEVGAPYSLSVPNNAMDIVGRAWQKGNYFGKGDANPATHRTMKTVRPTRLLDGDTVHYLWDLKGTSGKKEASLERLIESANRIVSLGWGIDLVVGRAEVISNNRLPGLAGERWLPAPATNASSLRTPVPGTLRALGERHNSFLKRIGDEGFKPVPPLTRFDVTGYRRATDPPTQPVAIFELRHDSGAFCRYSQPKLVHIAGMLRHLAIKVMSKSPPPGVDPDWVERYVSGHRDESRERHRQFSYLPLPSIGHTHADQLVRRVMITAPEGDSVWLEYLAKRLAGQQLIPHNGNEFGEEGAPTLVRVFADRVATQYSAPANRWASVTPVILPGHSDNKPSKTRKLIDAALIQSGIEQPCTYEWSSYSRFRRSLSAHKHDRENRANFYLPSYLKRRSAIHLTLTFDDDRKIPGPIVIGAGRHCGFGLMATLDDAKS